MKDEQMMDDMVDNVGIMQGFMDILAEDEAEDENMDETSAVMGRTPDSPEILMNNLRGDMRSVDARRDELANIVGDSAAQETPDAVLALLQPVLAQGGIGALPQMAPIAAGPQPPMMPPGMPPLPPGAPAEMMPPPPQEGGIAGLPVGGPPPMPPPIQMRAGGLVQRFSDGSDEDGVTRAEETSYLSGIDVPEQLRQQARSELVKLITSKPTAIPDLKQLATEKSNYLTELLGRDRGLTDAQLLFSLGQRAFNYAANVDDQGRPLRGGALARLAGATRTLPSEIGKYMSDINKEERQIKLLGYEAAEKDIAARRAENLKLLETQRKSYIDILKAAGKSKTEAGPFGSGLAGRSMDMFVKYAPLYANNELDPETERYFLAAVTNYTQPTVERYKDPDTDVMKEVVRRNELPNFVRTALKARGTAIPTSGTAPVAAAGAPTAVAPITGATQADIPQEVAPIVQSATQSTMFDLAGTGTGFVPVLVAGIVRNIPLEVAGRIKPEFQQGTTMVENMRNRIVNVLQENPRFAEGERKQILGELNLGPRLLDNKKSFINQITALDNVLDGIEGKTRELSTTAEVGSDNRKAANKKLEEINFIRGMIGVRARKIDNTEQWTAAPPGEYLVFDPTRKIYVLREKKRGQ